MGEKRLELPQGTLYPALHRLEQLGRIKAQWAISENSRRLAVAVSEILRTT